MAKRTSFVILCSLFVALYAPFEANSYVIPPAQILQFMVEKYSSVKTLKIIQITKTVEYNQEAGKAFGESISVIAPCLYRSEIAGQPYKRLIIHNGSRTLRITDGRIACDTESKDIFYPFLMVAQTPRQLLVRLEELGIDVEKSSLTRFEGIIAYVIGEKEEASPKLLIDKERFFPLLLQYDGHCFRFFDYKGIAKKLWFPHRIICSFPTGLPENSMVEEYAIKGVSVNPSLDESLFDIPLVRSQFGFPTSFYFQDKSNIIPSVTRPSAQSPLESFTPNQIRPPAGP